MTGPGWTSLERGETCAGFAPPCPSSPRPGGVHSIPCDYGTVFSQAAQAAGIDPRFLLAVAKQESRFAAAVDVSSRAPSACCS